METEAPTVKPIDTCEAVVVVIADEDVPAEVGPPVFPPEIPLNAT